MSAQITTAAVRVWAPKASDRGGGGFFAFRLPKYNRKYQSFEEKWYFAQPNLKFENCTVYLCVPYGSHNKQKRFPEQQ
jgi:hypothetical protein